ncbi:S-adenosyl-L-methionine-dependent methyltransferase [Amylocystis lapponica]|nr:S-adenosyl-L-methionine-dependent methyltransferase [Amylocystis lapponica]
MPRSPTPLLAGLARAIGVEAASRELRWMREAVAGSLNTSLDDMVRRRIRGEPLQYILGTQPFGPLTLLTRPPVLIPRPETEDWAIRLSKLVAPTRKQPVSLLDLCTGSGCIPLLLCHLWPAGSVHACGVDISETAVQLARDNAAICGIAIPDDSYTPLVAAVNQGGVNTFTPLLANMRDPAFALSARLCAPYDIVTSNPPYIPRREYDELPVSVKDYEDPRALLGDPDSDSHPTTGRGLSFYHTIADLLCNTQLLKDSGVVALEVGDGQAGDVARILEREGRMRGIDIWKDPWDKERVVVARK